MTLDDRASQLSKPELIRLLNAVYGVEEHIDDIIDRHLALATPSNEGAAALVDTLTDQLDVLVGEDDFYGYRGSYDFSERLGSVLSAIDELLRPLDLHAALTLTEAFLDLADDAFQRVDDSDGYVGDVFRDATRQWLAIAAELREQTPEAENWVDKVLNFFHDNDYGVLDDIIAKSTELLTEQELRQLAWRFEKEARQALASPKEPGRYNFEAANACIGIKSVAEALLDMTLYEQATLLTSPEPNTLQLASIVSFALDIGDVERAGHWLKQPQWQEDPGRHRSLRHLWLKRKGDTEQLKLELQQDFQQRPHSFTLEPLWLMANEQDRQLLKQQVESLSSDAVGLEEHLKLLMHVDSVAQAEALLLAQPDEWASLHYNTILNWIDVFSAHRRVLAKVVCYRALINDLLDRKYNRAYHHGARYFHQLLTLDKQIEDYRGLDDAQAFIHALQTKHWRKRSFWELADYPNKPSTD